jgi:uncharacterized protein DUF5670
MLWTIVIILVVLWLLRSLVHIGGSLINSPARNCCYRGDH